MKNDLIDRYVYAATRFLRRKEREDVSKEIYGLIDDMLTERCGENAPTEKDIRVVLTELGSPRELYEKYGESDGKCLIGQPYYSTYCFALKIVLSCVALGLTISALLGAFMEGQVWYAAVGNGLGLLFDGLLSTFAVLTILFAVLYRKGIRLGKPFDFDDLPPVPKKKHEISIADCVVGMVISTVFLIVFLTAPQVFSAVLPDTGEWIPIFNTEVIHNTWYVIVLFFLVGIARDTVKLVERRYNFRVLVTTVICDIASAALTFWWLWRPNIMSDWWNSFTEQVFFQESPGIQRIFGNFQYFFLGVILFALLLDLITTIAKTEKE